MSRKKKDNAKQGTYALCITMGIVLGFGLGVIFEQLLINPLSLARWPVSSPQPS